MRFSRMLLLTVLALLIGFAPFGAFAQQKIGDDKDESKDKIVSEDKEKEKEKKKEKDISKDKEGAATDKKARKKITDFTAGEIVVRDLAIANIEKATTSTRLRAEDMEARGDRDFGEAMKMVPGINVFQHAKGSIRFDMRGFDLDRVALLIDGIPVKDVYSATVDVSQFPVFNVSNIIINRGVSSALYGSSGMVGSVNLITQKPTELYAWGMGEWGQYNNWMAAASHGAKFGKFYYWLTASVNGSQGYHVSEKLTSKERTKWFYKLMNTGAYGKWLGDFTNVSTYEYLSDRGKWDHNSYTKYNVSLKAGYQVTSELEVGIMGWYFHKNQKSSTYSTNYSSQYSIYNTGGAFAPSWSDPPSAGNRNAYANDGNAGGFQNRVFVWPEYHNFNVGPYLEYRGSKFSVKANVFMSLQNEVLNSYKYQNHTAVFFGPSIQTQNQFTTWVGLPSNYGISNQPVHSIWTTTTYGFNVFPSVKLASWNRLNAALLYRYDEHLEEEQAMNTAFAPSVVLLYGRGRYETLRMGASTFTFALEDEMKPLDHLEITIGCSYDSQFFSKYRYREKGTANSPLNALVNGSRIMDQSSIMGTMDGFSPVFATTYRPIEMLMLRAAYSYKYKFPNLEAYKNYYKATSGYIHPERSHNANAGFEIAILKEKLIFNADYFITFFRDKLESVSNPYPIINNYQSKLYLNISEAKSQGMEAGVTSRVETKHVTITTMANYVLMYAENYDTSMISSFNRGTRVDETPVHQILGDVRLDFKSKTTFSTNISTNFNQIRYVPSNIAALFNTTNSAYPLYTTLPFKAQRLHTPVMINVRISQKIWDHFEVWAMCKNLLDDYGADPFNPGPGRIFYFGAKAEL